ncbi:hypothetical protein RUM44_006020 [Polyplax serrata]|uniref:ubiquitinyl hydrolase 1 n=1 Tax=Polyplax serrata TaxID=468196 RepID=A0ABR1AYR4_POLSC
MESNLVAEFVSKTGASAVEAHNCLQAKGWDLKLAIHEYLNSKYDGNKEKPHLIKHDSLDVTDSCCKKLSRGISRATDNVNLVNKARSELGLDFRENGIVCNINKHFIETPVFTFTLPDLSIFPDDFRQFLEKDLIEMSSLFSLEQAGRLNWWATNGVCQRLWPLATTGDGNCLLHAASLGMWGFHDRLLTLRKALHEFLSSSDCRDALWRRWRWQLTRLNAEAGLVYTEEEWCKEWNSIVSMASSQPRNSSRRRSIIIDKSLNKEVSENATYESLEEIHVLALSHVLKRPIVVIADTMLKDVHGEALAPILFGGIYLPLEISPSECHKSPLVLTYDAAHFSALVVMDKEMFADKSPHPPAVIPLTDSQHKLLPVQFSVDPGEDFVWGRDENSPHIIDRLTLGTKELNVLLKDYLNVVNVPISLTPLSDDFDFDLESETPCDEEDIEKKFYEVTDYELDDNCGGVADSGIFGTNKSRAAKQLQSVAKQFGSIGKSMSKKLKKNLETIGSKMTRTNSQKKESSSRGRAQADDASKAQDFILSARLYTEERHEYQEEMIKNYLNTARDRFEKEKRIKLKLAEENSNLEDERLQEQAKLEGPKNCITQGCNMYGTVLTSYLCTSCYEKQRQEELTTSINSPSLPRASIHPHKLPLSSQNSNHLDTARYGTGRSTFYMEASPKSYETAKNFSKSGGRTLKPTDETLYLSNSTFYNDKGSKAGFYLKDWKSSPAGANRNASQFSLGVDFPERSKTWQEEGNGQTDGNLVSTATGYCSPPGHNSWGNENLRKIQSYNLAREKFQPNVKSDGSQSILKARNSGSNPGSGSITISNMNSVSNQKKNSRELPEIENISRKQVHVQQSKAIANDNLVRTIPVRQSSQNSLDQLLKETSEYLTRNGEVKPGERIIPIELDGSEKKLMNGYSRSGNDDYVERKMCLNITCKFFGSPDLDNYCSQCYRGRFENLALDTVSRK